MENHSPEAQAPALLTVPETASERMDREEQSPRLCPCCGENVQPASPRSSCPPPRLSSSQVLMPKRSRVWPQQSGSQGGNGEEAPSVFGVIKGHTDSEDHVSDRHQNGPLKGTHSTRPVSAAEKDLVSVFSRSPG